MCMDFVGKIEIFRRFHTVDALMDSLSKWSPRSEWVGGSGHASIQVFIFYRSMCMNK